MNTKIQTLSDLVNANKSTENEQHGASLNKETLSRDKIAMLSDIVKTAKEEVLSGKHKDYEFASLADLVAQHEHEKQN
ncbi:MAG TPA: hypothetical protein VFC74_01530 [Oscillospiraceae bacterium]|nr:hypothetical protein [Oscillospiraceae bacterium]